MIKPAPQISYQPPSIPKRVVVIPSCRSKVDPEAFRIVMADAIKRLK